MGSKIIVSACLLGENCKYNGKNNLNEELKIFLSDKDIISVCPEVMGGLSTPRLPAEIEYGKSSEDVIVSRAKIFNNEGKDVSTEFISGAEEVLEIAKLENVEIAILKEGSPSCGSNFIYDGTFSSVKKEGMGVTAKLLTENGITVISEKNFDTSDIKDKI